MRQPFKQSRKTATRFANLHHFCGDRVIVAVGNSIAVYSTRTGAQLAYHSRHAYPIVAFGAAEQGYYSLDNRGVLVHQDDEVFDTVELLSHGAKLRHAIIGDKIVAYEKNERKILVLDRRSVEKKFDTNLDLLVTAMAYEHPHVAYIHGSQAVVLNIETHEQVVINRQTKLTAVALSKDGKKIAMAD